MVLAGVATGGQRRARADNLRPHRPHLSGSYGVPYFCTRMCQTARGGGGRGKPCVSGSKPAVRGAQTSLGCSGSECV